MGDLSYRVRGSYFESCNCEAIGECGRSAARSANDSTTAVLRPPLLGDRERRRRRDRGRRLSVALVYTYDDDEAGSPWSVVLHVDDDADRKQSAALKWLFLDGLHQLPWIRKARHLIGARRQPETTTIDRRRRAGRDKDRRRGHRSATRPSSRSAAASQATTGRATRWWPRNSVVEDEGFERDLQGNCAFAADFDYAAT